LTHILDKPPRKRKSESQPSVQHSTSTIKLSIPPKTTASRFMTILQQYKFSEENIVKEMKNGGEFSLEYLGKNGFQYV
jgi:hypothetical protein